MPDRSLPRESAPGALVATFEAEVHLSSTCHSLEAGSAALTVLCPKHSAPAADLCACLGQLKPGTEQGFPTGKNQTNELCSSAGTVQLPWAAFTAKAVLGFPMGLDQPSPEAACSCFSFKCECSPLQEPSCNNITPLDFSYIPVFVQV